MRAVTLNHIEKQRKIECAVAQSDEPYRESSPKSAVPLRAMKFLDYSQENYIVMIL